MLKLLVNEVLNLSQKYTNNNFLNKYIAPMTFKDNSTQLIETKILSALFTEFEIELELQKTIATVCALISHALEIHENIDMPGSDVDKNRYRQLAVLAGDYASSRYYELLAENNLIDDIKLFANAIQIVNETKMSRHFTTINAINSDVMLGWIKTIYTTIGKEIIVKYANSNKQWFNIHELLMMAHAITREHNKPIKIFQTEVYLIKLLENDIHTEERVNNNYLLQNIINYKLLKTQEELENIKNSNAKKILLEVILLIQNNVKMLDKETGN